MFFVVPVKNSLTLFYVRCLGLEIFLPDYFLLVKLGDGKMHGVILFVGNDLRIKIGQEFLS